MTYNHDLVKDGKQHYIKRDNSTLLQELVAANDRKQLQDEIIQSNIPLILNLVERFLRQNPRLTYLRDDLAGEGLLKLTQISRTFIPEGCSNLTHFIWVSVCNALRDYVRTNNYPNMVPLLDVAYTIEYGCDVEDIIDTYCPDVLENQIVKLRLEGRRSPETKKPDISEVLGLPPTRIRNAWGRARTRLRKKLAKILK